MRYLLLFVVLLGPIKSYSQTTVVTQETMHPSQTLFQFGMDVLYFLKEYTDACRMQFGEDRMQNLHVLYQSQENFKEAKNLLSKWTFFPNHLADRCRSELQKGINDIIESNEALIKIHRADSTEPFSDSAYAKAKWEKGKERIRNATKLFPRALFYFDGDQEMSPSNYYMLTPGQQQNLKDTINHLFHDELKKDKIIQELIGVAIIQQQLEASAMKKIH